MKTNLKSRIFAAMIATYVGAIAFPGPARAELADISNVPLANAPSDAVLPNLMYILDDSGSMRWDYMPDQVHYTSAGKTMNNCKDTGPNNFADQCSDVPNSSAPTLTYAEPPYNSPDFNKIYYNPDIYYQAPIDFKGTSMGDSLYDKAAMDGYMDPNTFRDLGKEYPEVFYCEPKSARFTAKISNTAGTGSGTVMDVSAIAAGYINVGDTLDSGNASNNTKIVSWDSGTKGGVGKYTVSVSQNKAAGTTFAVTMSTNATTNPSDEVLLSNACKRNGIDNLSSGTFQYWSTSTTNGGLPFTGYLLRKKRAIGKGIYFRITPNEYCSDDDLINCTASTTATGNFTIPAPVRWCKDSASALAAAPVSDTLPNTAPKCRAAFDPSSYAFVRYGRFQRFNVDAGYTKTAVSVRPDCTGAGGTCTVAEEKRNFANWYTWYRTRLSMMKTATGIAFKDIDDRYRVGFITLTPSPLADTYLKIDKFSGEDKGQKNQWYDMLYSQTNHGGTPLRQALSRVGRMYAGITNKGMNTGMKDDPVTHSCQQNFALLTTDGYWNDNPESLVVGIADEQINNQDNVIGTYVNRETGTLDGLDSNEKLVEPFVRIEQSKCKGNDTLTFNEYASTTPAKACGCPTSPTNQTAIWERTIKVTLTSTFLSGKKQTGPSESLIPGSATYRQVVACQEPLVEVKNQVMTQTLYNQCARNDNTTFSSGTQVACGCSATPTSGSGVLRRLKQRTVTFTRQITYTDGVQTDAQDLTTPAPTYGTISNASGTPGTCQTGGSSTPATPSPNPSAAAPSGSPSLVSSSGTNLTAPTAITVTADGDPVRTTTTAVGSANTLADVAMYYYKNDLRTSPTWAANISTDNVPTTDKDIAPHQHMVTFTLGMGLTGRMRYQKDYETAGTGDFAAIKAGTIGGCDWITDATHQCDWPAPTKAESTTLDDLWHAAVNGRGIYYSAGDPTTLSDSITGALAALKVQNAAAAASATSSPNITETENFIYSSTFRTVKWDGEVVAQRIDSITGEVLPAIEWSAQANLDARITKNVVAGDNDTRVIYTFEPSDTSTGLKPFLYDSLVSGVNGVSEQSWFDKKGSALSQWSSLTDPQKLIADDGRELINYLRGRSNNEITIFRDREHVLGDPVNATPAFIGKPRFAFNDTVDEAYGEFQERVKDRTGMLYIAANDGMLHALNGDTGAEVWAYVPRMVFPDLHKLAADKWSVNHQFNVDGSPQIMDIFDPTLKEWRTILVAGLNGGGRGYYALDITRADQGKVKGMWEICANKDVCEITDDDMGLSYGNPVITKLPSGKWVVLVTSGLNNTGPGSGRGFLYVLDALTGKVLSKVEATDGATNEGDTTTPSGFAKISAFANAFNTDNTATFVYGGDLFGNVWRFDMSSSTPKVMLMGELKDAGGKPQSITSRPELGVVEGFRVVYIGTGRYLGTSDLQDPATLSPALGWAWQQSVYAIKDKDARYGNIRKSTPGLVQQTITDAGSTRTISSNEVKWTANDGWYVDLNPGDKSPGERVNLDPQLVLGTLVVVANVPNENACTTGGDSFLYQFDYRSGSYVPGTTGGLVGTKFSGQITVGVVIVRLPKGVFKGIATGATGKKTSSGVNIGSGGGSGRRVSWRELVR